MGQAVFLSYASEDARAAERICTALRAAGIEVWFDRSELRGGDAWDSAIRRQIKSCALFIPLISANSHSRAEGYFRLEWKLAVDRSHLMATDRAFLVPVVIDGTPDSDDRVPDRFREVQWMRLPDGETPPAFVDRILRLLALPSAVRAATEIPAPEPASPPTVPPPGKAVPPLRKSWSRRSTLALLGVAAALVIVAWTILHFRSNADAPAAYSLADRRLTFAILPFQAPPNDPHGKQAAAATTDAFAALLEAEPLWAHTAPRRGVEEAVAHFSNERKIAKALDVHFLIRGTLAKDKDGYSVDAALVDGDSERVLATQSVAILGAALTPRWRADMQDVLDNLTFAALKAEAKLAENKPVEALDVRDLSFRAYATWATHHGSEAKDAYVTASDLLKRALTLAPDDHLATFMTADINLCNCVMAWSQNVEEQKAIGAAALDKYLRMDPTNSDMIAEKADLYDLRGRYEDALLIADSLLETDPENPFAAWTKARELLRLNRAPEAVPIMDQLIARSGTRYSSVQSLAAAVHYATADYASAAKFAQTATTKMSEEALRSRVSGTVRLTLAAAEARLGHKDRAQAALADFDAAVPNTKTIAAIKKWTYSTAFLSGYEPLYEGLRMAGVPE
jgi:tetratricopeptide (TPR) repeat protein